MVLRLSLFPLTVGTAVRCKMKGGKNASHLSFSCFKKILRNPLLSRGFSLIFYLLKFAQICVFITLAGNSPIFSLTSHKSPDFALISRHIACPLSTGSTSLPLRLSKLHSVYERSLSVTTLSRVKNILCSFSFTTSFGVSKNIHSSLSGLSFK